MPSIWSIKNNTHYNLLSNVPSADPALSLLPLRLVFASRESLVGERKGNYLSQERLLIARSLTRLVSCIVDSENRSRMIKKVRREISNIHGNRRLMALSLSLPWGASERERALARVIFGGLGSGACLGQEVDGASIRRWATLRNALRFLGMNVY